MPALARIVRAAGSCLDPPLEQVADGFVFTEGPVWAKPGYVLFSSPNTNVIYRWSREGTV